MPPATTGASGLAGRYATALFELAESRKMLDEVADDLAHLRAMMEESADLRRLISSPVISREDQAGAMTALADAAGMSGLTRNFFGLVAINR
ncbi:MAG: F0F1 ATP synthase subunit delta, partial [Alphaproteobacteria bacterium]